MAGVSDAFQHLSIDTVDARLLIWRVQEVTTLIVAVDLDSLPTDYTPHTEEALEMIEQGMLWCSTSNFFLNVLCSLFVT